MTRREALLGSLRLAVYAGLSQPLPSLLGRSPQGVYSVLKTASPCSERLIGIATDKTSLEDASFARAVTRDFNLLTVSGMKWDRIHPGPDTYDFIEADWNMRFAEENDLRVHGHNLCWNSPATYPGWFKTVLSRNNARQFLTDHITTVMKRYQGRISSWDVVNEPVVSWPGRSDGLYPGVWLDLLGPEYLDIAFHAAALADPGALRVLNIHHVEQGTPDDELTRSRALALLKQLIGRGVPVEAVGLESHLDASQALGGAPFRQFVTDIRSLNLQVLVTELDVAEERVGQPQSWDAAAAKYYGDYLDEVIPSANPQTIIFWSLRDRWENGRRIQGLMQNTFSPRLTYPAALKALRKDPSCDLQTRSNQ